MKHQQQGFYVGYLPLPVAHARLFRIFVPIIVVLLAVLAALIAGAQRDPGDGRWHNTTDARVWTGVLVAQPLPALVVPGEPEIVYHLVENTKRGAQDRSAGLDGHLVSARGWLLERDGRSIIELVAEDNALVSQAPGNGSAASLELVRDNVTMAGEILDSKCYLGAMKPGDGLGHRACAQLCIAGGIPPMLLSSDADGSTTYTMLMSSLETDLPGVVMEYVGIPVSITGTLYRLAGVRYLDIQTGSVERLPGK